MVPKVLVALLAAIVLAPIAAAQSPPVVNPRFGTGLSLTGNIVNGVLATNAAVGVMRGDGTSLTCTAGVCTSILGGGGISQLTGDVTAGPGSGSQAATLANTAVTPGSYTATNLTVDAKGRITAAASGTAVSFANPTATVSGSAVNGSASTAMRSDAAPALAVTAVTPGSYTATNLTVDQQGRITAAASGTPVSFANPTATISGAAVNGAASTAMRSDAAPALAATAVTPGSYTYSSLTVDQQGRLTAASNGTAPASAANPTATAGASAINGAAATFMRSDAAPAVAKGSSSVFGIVEVDNTTITASGGVISAVSGAAGINQLTGDVTAGPGVGSAAATLASTNTARADLGINVNGALKVTTAGAASQAACADLSNAGPGCSATGISQRLAIGWPAAIDPSLNIIGTVDEASTVQSIVGTVATAVGATATVSVYKAPSGTACAAGTVLHSGSFNANGTANTNQTLTLTTTALSAGDRICLVTANGSNWTAGLGVGGITVRLTTP